MVLLSFSSSAEPFENTAKEHGAGDKVAVEDFRDLELGDEAEEWGLKRGPACEVIWFGAAAAHLQLLEALKTEHAAFEPVPSLSS